MPQNSRGKVFRNSRYGNSRPQRQGQYINPDKFINKAAPITMGAEFVPRHQFSDFGLAQALQRNVETRQFVTPTPIQDGAIVPAMAGRDIIGLANTGTGKTAAFVLPIIHRLTTRQTAGTVLIIAPTRELAIQIDADFRSFARGLGVYSALCVGGAGLGQQISALARRPQVVIGTPGRLKDLFNQHALILNRTSVLVLDEADRMLDMGFIKDIRFLLDQLPAARQTLCFSATIPAEIRQLLNSMMQNPVTISVKTAESSDQVEQNVIRAVSKDHKLEILGELLTRPEFTKTLVFGRTKWSVQKLADSLRAKGVKAAAIHGNKTQGQRQQALKAFKEGRIDVLVATDVAARGLDIPGVSHVINFDQPATYDDYVHRIGRTGRAGARGQALTFIGQ